MLDPSRFHAGANLPWIRYGCDFGANAWQPAGGLSARGVPDDVKQWLTRMGRANAGLVRWFLFTDGRAGITFNGAEPTGIDAHLFDDIEAALALAAETGVTLMLTLFDFHWCHPARVVNEVQLGGRASTFAHADLRASLMETVLTPLLRAFGTRPEIAAWDVINEPEWVTGSVRSWHPWAAIRRHAMRQTIDDVRTLVRQFSPHPITVGLASRRWLSFVEGLSLDFHQVHWYDRIDGDTPPDWPRPAPEGKPVMLGEFPTLHSRFTPEALLEMAERSGYFAALPWSLLASDAATSGGEALCRVFEGYSGTNTGRATSSFLNP